MMLTDFKGLQWAFRVKNLKIKVRSDWGRAPRSVILVFKKLSYNSD